MTQTTYYEFNKPEGTDLVNPLVDTNPNWDALDADLHEFNERSIANCTEVVALGVHTISRLDTTAKFLKWIATANYTAGETFTVDGLPVAATTPAGAALATNAYVTGSVVLACLNADNTAMTIYVSGTTVASDAEKLGGKLPSYYATQSDMSDAETDITNLQNQVGNTSIVGIGDGTCTGAIDALNTEIADKASGIYSSNEIDTGNTWVDGKKIFRKCYSGAFSIGQIIDATLTSTYISSVIDVRGTLRQVSGEIDPINLCDGNNACIPIITNAGLSTYHNGYSSTFSSFDLIVEYTKAN